MRVPQWVERIVREQVDKELKMAKKKLVIENMDGDYPTMSMDGLLNLRAPLQYAVPPGGEAIVRFGFRANRALLLVQSEPVKLEGWDVIAGLGVVQAGHEPQIRLKNNHPKNNLTMRIGDVVVRAAILDASDYQVEKA